MDITAIRHRLRTLPPWAGDLALAVALSALACLQIWAFSHARSPEMPYPRHPGVPPDASASPRRHDSGSLQYLVAVLAFLPLALKRRWPALTLLLSGAATATYTMMPFAPVFIVLSPMIALYSFASLATTRRRWIVAASAFGLAFTLPLFYYTEKRWVVEVVGMYALLVAAFFLGDTARSRREYIAEVEERAREALRSRDEEALRRVGEERIRIAREVHDIVAHSLSIVTVQAAAADALIETDHARAHESLGHIRSTSKQALAELRSMLSVLRTSEPTAPLSPVSDLGRLPALVTQVRDAGIAVELNAPADPASVPAAVSLSAYRIVQEALTNVVRHAKASTAEVTLELTPKTLVIEVADDGIGAHAVHGVQGHGIAGMAERVSALGGSFSAGPRDSGHGFIVRATLPLSGKGDR